MERQKETEEEDTREVVVAVVEGTNTAARTYEERVGEEEVLADWE